MKKTDTSDYIDLLAISRRLFRFLKLYMPILLLSSCISAGIFSIFGVKEPTITYSAQVVFSYGVKTANATEFNYQLSNTFKSYEIDRLSESIKAVVKSDFFKEALKKNSETDISPISVSFTPSTNLGTLSSVSSEKKIVLDTLDSTIKLLPDFMRPVIGSIEIHIQGVPEVTESIDTGLSRLVLGVIGFVTVFVAGFSIIVVSSFIKKEMGSVADIDSSLSLKVYGSLPLLRAKKHTAFFSIILARGFFSKLFLRKTIEFIRTTDYQERLRLISMQINEDLRNKHINSLIIISTKHGEGKTFFSETLAEELSYAGWNVRLTHDLSELMNVKPALGNNDIVLLDSPGITTDISTMEAADCVDASLLVVKSDNTLASDANWGLHFLKSCRANCIGTILNACF